MLAVGGLVVGPTAVAAEPGPPGGTTVAFSDLPGVATEDFVAAFTTFRASCVAVDGAISPRRAAVPPPAGLRAACRRALALPPAPDPAGARKFFETAFEPRQLAAPAFFTGYYEPVVEGSLLRTEAFTTPLLALPADLVTTKAIASRRRPDGSLLPMPDRAAIETGALGADAVPLVWLREPVDAFFVQVQGSARIALPDGTLRRVAYAGRNGHPYTSIGKVLVDRLHIPPDQMGMADLKRWIRANGQGPNDAGTELMRTNRSYIFFRFEDRLPAEAGPVGAAGVSLTPLRSLAVDRTAWSYGLPFYVDAEMPWQSDVPTPLRRVMVAQDTGSAILGPARGDIFFGTGPTAALRAGPIRHSGTLYVLWPKDGAAHSDAKAAR